MSTRGRRSKEAVELLQGNIVLSRLMSRPGASQTPFDVLAACVSELSPGGPLAILGFGAGGVLAPLRALGFRERVDGIDIDETGFSIFREVAAPWSGNVRLRQAEASRWLGRKRSTHGAIIEDLAVDEGGDAVKPWESVTALPQLALRALRPGGVAVTNVLPSYGATWKALLGNLAAPFDRAFEIRFADYDNRILVCGAELPSTRLVSHRVRRALRSIESRQAERLELRTLK